MSSTFQTSPGTFGRILLVAATLGCASTITVRAAHDRPIAKPVQKDESFEALKKEFDEAREKYFAERRKEAETQQKAAQDKMRAAQQNLKAAQKAVEDAKTDKEKQAAQKNLQMASISRGMPAMRAISPADGPGETFSPRFLAFAVAHPKDPALVNAFHMTLVTSGGPTGKVGTWGQAVKALQADHVEDAEFRRAVSLFRVLAGSRDEAADKLLRDVLAKNPDRRARGRACQALAQGRQNAADLGKRLEVNADFRRNAEAALGGKEEVQKLIADAPAAKTEAEELTRTLRADYDDMCPDLSIGKTAPQVASQDLEGKPVKLSALKGKVVVLDIWATWCGPCKAMIPHEREMVGRLEGKPFVLVSISTDEQKETLTKFLAKEKMPWTHWFNGNEGGIIEDWDIQAYPTIYVLDAKGLIRHRDLRGEKLEEAVNELLKEIESKSSK